MVSDGTAVAGGRLCERDSPLVEAVVLSSDRMATHIYLKVATAVSEGAKRRDSTFDVMYISDAGACQHAQTKLGLQEDS